MDIFLIFCLILLNAIFALGEMSIAASRRNRLESMLDTEKNKRAVELAIALHERPNDYLPAALIAITLAAVLSGILSEGAIIYSTIRYLKDIGIANHAAEPMARIIIAVIITATTVLIGDLIPKRIALSNPEHYAIKMSKIMIMATKILKPIVFILSEISNKTLSILNIKNYANDIKQEDVLALIERSEEAGLITTQLKETALNALTLEDKNVTSVMTPRDSIDFIELERAFDYNKKTILESSHSKFPVCKGGLDNVLGWADSKTLLNNFLLNKEMEFSQKILPTIFIPEMINLSDALNTFKTERAQFSMVVNENGAIVGMLTLADMLGAIAGDIRGTIEENLWTKRGDGTFLVDGSISLEKLKLILDLEYLHEEELGNYYTLGGFVMNYLSKVPKNGDNFETDGYKFEVVDMDKSKVDQVLITKI